MKYAKILASTLLLLTGSSLAKEFTSKDCKSVSSCSDCINYINNDMLDGTKCVPVSGGCRSWNDV